MLDGVSLAAVTVRSSWADDGLDRGEPREPLRRTRRSPAVKGGALGCEPGERLSTPWDGDRPYRGTPERLLSGPLFRRRRRRVSPGRAQLDKTYGVTFGTSPARCLRNV